MAFKFKYQTVLKYREDLEQQAKNNLAVAITDYERSKEALLKAQDMFFQYKNDYQEAIKNGMSASRLSLHENGKRYYKDLIEAKLEEVDVCKRKIDECRALLLNATQEKKKMEKLKEKDKREYENLEHYEEMLLNDHIVTYKASLKAKED